MDARSSVTGKIGRLSAARPWWVILTWVIVAVGVVTLGGRVTPVESDDAFLGTIESQQALHAEEAAFHTSAASELLVIHSSEFTVHDPEFRNVAEGLMRQVGDFDGSVIGT